MDHRTGKFGHLVLQGLGRIQLWGSCGCGQTAGDSHGHCPDAQTSRRLVKCPALYPFSDLYISALEDIKKGLIS